MKTTDILAYDRQTDGSLHKLADQIIRGATSMALRNRNSIVNNIPSQFHVNINEHIIASVIRQVLQAVVRNAFDSVVYISAKRFYETMIEVVVKDENCFNAYGIALSLQDAVRAAKSIQGTLTISNPGKNITVVSFMFPVE